MTLSLVILEEAKSLNSKYENYQGLFIKDGCLCYKPKKESNICYEISGDQFEYANEPVYRAYFEGGTKGIQVNCQEFEDKKEKTNPSYGLISFNRINRAAKSLFGSSIKHENPIQMILYHASIERSVNKDWYYPRGRIVEIEMSQSQFADLITSFNNGNGTPCTIRFTERDGYIPECDYVNKVEQFQKEFSNDLYDIRNDLDKSIIAINEILETRKTLRKIDKETILSILNNVKQTIGCNSDFVLNSFNEQMERTITEAKSEIEAFMSYKVHELALEAIRETEDLKIVNPIKLE